VADSSKKRRSTPKEPQARRNLVQGELMGRLKPESRMENSPITMKGVAFSADLVSPAASPARAEGPLRHRLSSAAKTSLPSTRAKSRRRSPTTPLSRRSLMKTSPPIPNQVEQYRGGKKTVAAFFIGQGDEAQQRPANPTTVNELLIRNWTPESAIAINSTQLML